MKKGEIKGIKKLYYCMSSLRLTKMAKKMVSKDKFLCWKCR